MSNVHISFQTLYTPLRIYLDSEAKTIHLALYSSILDLRSNVLHEATVQNVTIDLMVLSYTRFAV